jgi:hypothetical protein
MAIYYEDRNTGNPYFGNNPVIFGITSAECTNNGTLYTLNKSYLKTSTGSNITNLMNGTPTSTPLTDPICFMIFTSTAPSNVTVNVSNMNASVDIVNPIYQNVDLGSNGSITINSNIISVDDSNNLLYNSNILTNPLNLSSQFDNLSSPTIGGSRILTQSNSIGFIHSYQMINHVLPCGTASLDVLNIALPSSAGVIGVHFYIVGLCEYNNGESVGWFYYNGYGMVAGSDSPFFAENLLSPISDGQNVIKSSNLSASGDNLNLQLNIAWANTTCQYKIYYNYFNY